MRATELAQIGCGREVERVCGWNGLLRDRSVRGGQWCGLLSRHPGVNSLGMMARSSSLL